MEGLVFGIFCSYLYTVMITIYLRVKLGILGG